MKQCFELYRTDSIHKNCHQNWTMHLKCTNQTSRSFLARYVPVHAESSLATITNPVFGQHLLTIY